METTETLSVIGYKAFNNDMTCLNNFQYEVNKTYTINDEIELCKSGFHFCIIPVDVLTYYDKNNSKFAIIKATGKIEHDRNKSVCSQITIEKLITLDELYNLTNGKFVRNNIAIEYYQNGRLHREDGPAIEWKNGDKYWYKNGEFHREDGPAIENVNGYKAWYKNGERHREDGPAIECSYGDKEWYKNGERYCIEYAYGKVWHKNGWYIKN